MIYDVSLSVQRIAFKTGEKKSLLFRSIWSISEFYKNLNQF